MPVDGHIAQLATMRFNELFTLHKHAARAAARVIHLAAVGVEHGDQGFDDAGRRVKLTATLDFSTAEHAKKVLVDLAQNVASGACVVARAYC